MIGACLLAGGGRAEVTDCREAATPTTYNPLIALLEFGLTYLPASACLPARPSARPPARPPPTFLLQVVHIESLLLAAVGAMSFVVIVPGWLEAPSWRKVRPSNGSLTAL
jgi:hypothetical protein